MSKEIERAVIGALLSPDKALTHEMMGGLTESSFEDRWCRVAFGAIRDLLESGETLDAPMVHSRSGLPFAEVAVVEANAPLPDAARGYVRELALAALKRRLAAFGRYVETLATQTQAHQVRDAIKSVQHRAMAEFLDLPGESNPLVSFDEVLRLTVDEMRQAYEAARSGQTVGVVYPTGINGLDTMLNGGWPGRELTVLAARTSMGKSVVAMNSFYRAAQISKRHCHLYVSLEMPKTSLGRRVLASKSRVAASSLKTGHYPDSDAARLMGAVKALRGIGQNAWMLDLPGASAGDVVMAASRIQQETGLPLGTVWVDHLHIMRTDPRRDYRFELGRITLTLLELARNTEAAVIALGQCNRECEKRPDKRPMKSDLKEAGAIEENANNIIFVYRDSVYNPEADPSAMELLISKQRDGATGTVNCHYDAAIQLVEDARGPR